MFPRFMYLDLHKVWVEPQAKSLILYKMSKKYWRIDQINYYAKINL